MNAVVREYKKEDVPAMRAIWNEVVAEGAAFPQMEELDPRQAEDFSRTRAAAAWRKSRRRGALWACIFCTPIM